MDDVEDGLPELADMLGVSERDLRDALGGPWSRGQAGPDLGGAMTTFTGLVNPRAPSRPLVAIRVEPDDLYVEVGHAVGVPVPTGAVRWALGDPRTGLSYDVDDRQDNLLADLRDAVHRVAEAAVLRGTTW